MKRMLFNATQAEELRVAIVEGQKLVDLDIESASKEQRKGNIYKGVVTRVEPSLEAAFVDYGCERHGFLPFKEIARAALPGGGKPQDVLKEGQELLVQVEKDERGNKGAALTTYISLAGRYVVLMPTNPRGGGVSRRIEGEERNELRDTLAQLEIPEGMSLIARTAGIGRTVEEFQWDLNYLLSLWKAIDNAARSQSGPFLIYQEGSLVIRAIRDYFSPDIGEILIDTEDVYEQARQFMAHVMPANVNKVKLYRDDVPLFSRFQIEHQIETAYSRQVNLPSGGAIVIDHTEALVAIDVNSARATKGQDVEQTAFNTNLEAADEIARQMRLRDLGGLIVIDFIDMENPKHQREVENRLRDALHHDRARVQTGKISRFGLLELSRQRLQPSLGETSYNPCPRCHGTGHIRGTESSALHILRIIQEEAMKENTGAIHVQLPVDVATFLLNEKRLDIHTLETRLKVNIFLIPNIHLETPNYTITRLRHDELNRSDIAEPSYKMATLPEPEAGEGLPGMPAAPAPRQEAAVKSIAPAQPAPQSAPVVEAPPPGGLFGRILGWFKKHTEEPAPEPVAEVRPRTPRPVANGEARRERKPQPARRPESRGEPRAEGRPERAAESARPPRAPKAPKPRAEKPAEVEVKPAVEAEIPPAEAREPRSRRGRGARRSREDRPRQAEAGPAEALAAPAAAPVEATPAFGAIIEYARPASAQTQPAEIPAQRSLELETRVVKAKPEEVLQAIDLDKAGLQQVETQTTAAETTPVAPQAPQTRRRSRPTEAAAPTESGLQQVETVAAPASAAGSEQPPAPHPTRRRPRPQTPVADEPLVQVETGGPRQD